MPGLYNQSPGALYDPMTLRQREDIQYQMSPDAPAATPLNLGDEDWERPDYRRDPLKPVSGIPKPGLFTRLNYTPGGADALIALGAGLLSGNGFADGLARGATGFSNALEEGRQRNIPKTSFLADGAFIVQTDPRTGKTQIVRNPQVADYYRDNKLAEFQGKVSLAEAQGNAIGARLERSQAFTAGQNDLDRQDRRDARAEDRDWRHQEAEATRDFRRDLVNAARATRQVPPAAIRGYTEFLDKSDQAREGITSVGNIIGMLDSGKLRLDGFSNLKNSAALATGLWADEGTQNYALFKQGMTELQRVYLLANKGVQTDRDADLAMQSLSTGSGDEASVRKNLQVVMRRLEVLRQGADRNADIYSRQYGIDGPASGQPSRSSSPASSGGWSAQRIN